MFQQGPLVAVLGGWTDSLQGSQARPQVLQSWRSPCSWPGARRHPALRHGHRVLEDLPEAAPEAAAKVPARRDAAGEGGQPRVVTRLKYLQNLGAFRELFWLF